MSEQNVPPEVISSNKKLLKKQIKRLERELRNIKQTLFLAEDSATKMERVYKATLETLAAQKQDLANKNNELKALHTALRKQNKILEKVSSTDALTGAYNRRKFLLLLDDTISDFTRYSTPASIIIMDLDHFKRVNDTYGHQAGDDILKQFSQLSQNHLRKNDVFARWGGEEFVALLRFTDISHAYQVAENLRIVIEQDSFMQKYRVTCSFGLARMEKTLNADEFIHNADVALYKAKEQRNKVVAFDEAIFA